MSYKPIPTGLHHTQTELTADTLPDYCRKKERLARQSLNSDLLSAFKKVMEMARNSVSDLAEQNGGDPVMLDRLGCHVIAESGAQILRQLGMKVTVVYGSAVWRYGTQEESFVGHITGDGGDLPGHYWLEVETGKMPVILDLTLYALPDKVGAIGHPDDFMWKRDILVAPMVYVPQEVLGCAMAAKRPCWLYSPEWRGDSVSDHDEVWSGIRDRMSA